MRCLQVSLDMHFNSHTAPTVERTERIRIQRSRTAQLWPGRIRGKAINGVLYTLRAVLYLFRAWRRRNVLLLTTAPPFLPIIGYLAYSLVPTYLMFASCMISIRILRSLWE